MMITDTNEILAFMAESESAFSAGGGILTCLDGTQLDLRRFRKEPTFEAFAASCTHVRTHLIERRGYMVHEDAEWILAYMDNWYIEKLANGTYFLQLEMQDKTSPNLEELERDLYAYALASGELRRSA